MRHIAAWTTILACTVPAASAAAAEGVGPSFADAGVDAKQATVGGTPGGTGCTSDADCGAGRICSNTYCVTFASSADGAASGGQATELPGVMGIVTVGPTFENSYGGVGTHLSLAAGGYGSYFTIGIHLRTGGRWEDRDPKIEAGAELGYRFMTRLSSGMIPHLVVTIGYSHLTQIDEGPGTVYHWSIPHARIGGGLMWGPASGLKYGFEVSYFGGYAFHDNAYENPWGQIYEWPYNAGHVHFILAF